MPAFTIPNTPTLTVSNATHGLGTAALLVQAYDNATPRRQVEGVVSIHPSTFAVTIDFLQAVTGTLLIARQLQTAVSVPFASTLSTTVVNTTHGFATPNLFVTVYDSAGQPVDAEITVHPTTFAVTATFLQALAGRVVIASAEQSGPQTTYTQVLTNTTGGTIPAATHGLGSPALFAQVMDNATPAVQVRAPVTVHPTTGAVTLAFLQPVTGTLILGGGAGVQALTAEPGSLSLSGGAVQVHVRLPAASLGTALAGAPVPFVTTLAAASHALTLAGTPATLRKSDFIAGRQNFTNQAVVTIAGTDHDYGTAALLVQVYDNALAAARLDPQIAVDPSTFDVTVTFLQSTSGYVLVTPAIDVTYGQTFSNALTVTVPAASHGFPVPNLLVQVYDAAGREVHVPITVHQTTRLVTATFLQAQSGRIVVANASAVGTPTNPSQTFTATTLFTLDHLTHALGTPNLLVQTYDAGTPALQTQGEVVVHPSTADVTVTFLHSTSGRLVVGGGTASQVMSAEQGSSTLLAAIIGLRTTLPLASTSYALTGTAMTPRLALPAAPALLTLPGTAATFRPTLPITSGASVLTGTAATLLYGQRRVLPADPASATLVGTATTLRHVARLFATAGTSSAVGTAVAFAYRRPIQTAPGTVTLTGTALALATTLPGAFSSHALLGTDALLLVGQHLAVSADPGAASGTGTPATLRYLRRMPATAGSAALVGTPAVVARQRLLRADPGPSFATGMTAPLRLVMAVAAGSGTCVGTAATLRYGHHLLLSVDPGLGVLSGAAATLRHVARMAAGAGNVTISGTAVGLPQARRLTATSTSVTLAGTAVTLRHFVVIRLTADPSLTTLSGAAVALELLQRFAADPYTLTVTGTPSTLRLRVPATAGPFLLTGTTATLHVALHAPAGLVTAVGADIALLYGAQRSLVAGVGALALGPATVALRHLGRMLATPNLTTATPADVTLITRLPAAPHLLPVVGQGVPLRLAMVLATGTRSLLGTPMTPRHAARLSAAPGPGALSGTDASLRYGLRNTLMASSRTFTLAGTATLRRLAVLPATPGASTLAPLPVLLPLRVPVGPAVLLLSGAEGTLTIDLPVAHLDLVLSAAAALLPLVMPAEASLVVSVTPDAALRYAQQLVILAHAGHVAVLGTPATLRLTSLTGADVGLLSLTGSASTLGLRIPSAPSVHALSGTPVRLRGDRCLIATDGLAAVPGTDLVLRVALSLTSGSLTVTGTPIRFVRARGGLVADSRIISLGLHRDSARTTAAPTMRRALVVTGPEEGV